jgi:hypothetical protein
MCPRTTMCPHTAIYVPAYYYMCPHTTIYVSSYYYVCVPILLYTCVLILLYMCCTELADAGRELQLLQLGSIKALLRRY